MATRDQTAHFVRFRSLQNQTPGSRRGDGGKLLASGGGSGDGVDMTPLDAQAPRFVETSNDLQSVLTSAQTRLEELGRLIDQRARINFDPQLEAEKDREIELQSQEITRACGLASRKIGELNRVHTADATEFKMLKNIITRSAKQLSDLTLDFRKKQKQYLGRRKRMLDGSGFGSILGGGGGSGGAEDEDQGFTEGQLQELASSEQEVDERMQEIQRIAKSVAELAVLFKDLNTLVVEQGTILDRIDHNMEAAVQHVKKGLVEIETADEYSKKAAPTKCMLILMVMIVIVVIYIIIKYSGRK